MDAPHISSRRGWGAFCFNGRRTAMKKKNPSDEELKKYTHKKMTLPLMEHAPEETKEQVWKLVKKISTFSYSPCTPAEYKRMAAFAENDAVVDVVLDTLKDLGYPFKLLDELVDYVIANHSPCILPLARNMDVLSKDYPDLTNILEKAKIIFKIDAIDGVKKGVAIQINKLYPDYTREFVVRIREKGKNIYSKKFKHQLYRTIEYAVVRDVLLRKHAEELQIDDVADARVAEAMKADLRKLFNEIAITVNNKDLKYIQD